MRMGLRVVPSARVEEGMWRSPLEVSVMMPELLGEPAGGVGDEGIVEMVAGVG